MRRVGEDGGARMEETNSAESLEQGEGRDDQFRREGQLNGGE